MNVKEFFLSTKDCLMIERAEVACRVGETAEERAFPQILFISAQIILPLQQAGQKDNLNLTVNYMEVIHQIRKGLSKRQFSLIEAVGEFIAHLILQHKYVQEVSVKITKKVDPGVASVSAYIYRKKA